MHQRSALIGQGGSSFRPTIPGQGQPPAGSVSSAPANAARPNDPGVGNCGMLPGMDPLRKDDIERMRRMPPEERMRAVLAAVNAGVRIRLATLRARRPQATDGELEAAL